MGNMFLLRNSNSRVKCDKHPADYCVIFDDSEVLSVFNFVVGACALREQLDFDWLYGEQDGIR